MKKTTEAAEAMKTLKKKNRELRAQLKDAQNELADEHNTTIDLMGDIRTKNKELDALKTADQKVKELARRVQSVLNVVEGIAHIKFPTMEENGPCPRCQTWQHSRVTPDTEEARFINWLRGELEGMHQSC